MSQRAQQDRMLQRQVALQRGGAMAAAAVSAARPISQSVPQPGALIFFANNFLSFLNDLFLFAF